MDCSKERIWPLTVGCVRKRSSAAFEKLFRLATRQKVSRCRKSICDGFFLSTPLRILNSFVLKSKKKRISASASFIWCRSLIRYIFPLDYSPPFTLSLSKGTLQQPFMLRQAQRERLCGPASSPYNYGTISKTIEKQKSFVFHTEKRGRGDFSRPIRESKVSPTYYNEVLRPRSYLSQYNEEAKIFGIQKSSVF